MTVIKLASFSADVRVCTAAVITELLVASAAAAAATDIKPTD